MEMKENEYLMAEPPLMISSALAKLIGLNKSIILRQLHCLLGENEINENILKDRKTWCRKTYREWEEQFPFWNIQTIRKIILSLEKDGIVISANFNQLKGDKTKWYTIDYKKLATILKRYRPVYFNKQ